MFLALKEIQFSKFKYLLVIGLLFLISYLVFFLSGLANGLAQSNRSAIDEWQADHILLADGVDHRLQMSMFNQQLFSDVKAEDKTAISVQMMLFDSKDSSDTLSAQLIGIDKNSFVSPQLIEGRVFDKENEIIVDETFLNNNELRIGDTLSVKNSTDQLTIVGVTKNHQLSVQPVAYINRQDFTKLESTFGVKEHPLASAIITRGETSLTTDDLEVSPIDDFIQDLPGYQAQNLTFGLMIGFLVVIAAVVISIFIYVLTLQKESVFGILKAQGISNSYLIRSVVYQTLLLAGIGVLLGAGLTYGSAYVLPSAVPFTINHLFIGVIGVAILFFALLGGLFSSRMITKIDPLEAI